MCGPGRDGGGCRATSLGRSLLSYHMLGRRHRAGGGGLRDRERQPRVPAGRAIGRIEFAISFQAQKCLIVPNRENISNLRANAENARAEAAESGRLTEVVCDLLIGIADEADEDLLRQELRHAPVEMEIDAALVLSIRILEIVGEAADAGEFCACRGVQIGVAAAEVDGAMTEADI